MALIEWTDSFLIGIPEMDSQHRRQVELINRLDEAVRMSKKNPETLGILIELAAITKTHFGDEEKIMQESGFAETGKHCEVHRKLLNTINDVIEKVKAGKMTITESLPGFMQIWLEKHIVGFDQKYVQHLAAMKTAGAGK